VKVSVSNFKVDKSENLDNASYVFLHDTSKNVKSRVFGFKKRKKNIFSNLIVVNEKICAVSTRLRIC